MPPSGMQVFFGLALPLLWAAALWSIWAWVLVRRPSLAALGNLIGAAAIAGAAAFAFFAIGERGDFPPVDNVEWLFYGLPALALLGTAEGFLHAKFRPLIWAISLGAMAGLVGQNFVRNADGWRGWPFLALAGWVVAGMDVRAAAGRLSRDTPRTGLLILGLTSACLAACMEMHGSHLVMPFRAASVGLALLPLFLLLFLKATKQEIPAAALTAWSAFTVTATLAMVLYFPKFPLAEGLLLGIAPLRAGCVPTKWAGWKGSAARVGAALIPLSIAVLLALVPFLKEMAEGSSGY